MRTPTLPPVARHELLACLGLLAAVKLLVLAIDPTLRLFLGDSESYLHAAHTGWIAPDRSFTYSWLIRGTAVQAASSTALIAAQTLLGIGSAMLLFAVLRFGWRVAVPLAQGIAVLFALDPAQLFYERMLMAESAGQFALTLQIALSLYYVRRGHWWLLPLAVAAGLLAVSLRMSLLPVVLGLTLCAPLVRAWFHHADIDRGRPLVALARLGLHLTVALSATVWMHGEYKQLYGKLARVKPTYIASDGRMRLGLVAPLVRPQHLHRAGIDPALLAEVSVPLADHRARESHIWLENGLYGVLERKVDDPEAAAGKISIRAVRDDPFGMLRLSALTLADYFDVDQYVARLEDDLGRRPLPKEMLDALREHLRYDARGIATSTGPVTTYFKWGSLWLTACLFLLVPLALAMLVLRWQRCDPRDRDLTALLTLAACGLVASHMLFSHIISFRYLHPLPWLMLAVLALLADAVRRGARKERRGRTSVRHE